MNTSSDKMDDSLKHRKEEYEMLEALYDFSATIPQTLSFQKEDVFIFHSGNNMQKKWWSVINLKGKMGYIPSNYVNKTLVTKDKVINFLNHSIEHLGSEIAKVGGGSDKQLELMQELISRKQELVERKHKSKSQHKEKITSSKSLPNSTPESGKRSCAPSPPLRHTLSESKFNSMTPERAETPVSADHTPSKQAIPAVVESVTSNINPNSSYCIVQQVRSQTGLSHEASRIAVGVVVEGLLEIMPSVLLPSLEQFLVLLEENSTPPPDILDDTVDAVSLKKILEHLTACKDDAQQRSWQLWDDENTIKQQIIQLSSILSNADPAISVRVLTSGGFEDVTTLVQYYQMEERWSIRHLLLETFNIMCSLDKIVTRILLNSVLPSELAREMLSNINEISRLTQPAELLTRIFSLGEPMPITHLEYLGPEFIKQMLELIESERENEISDKILTLLLSYNLQFKPHSSANITVDALKDMDCAKTFTEKLLLLINREDDPLTKLKSHETPYHSVVKLIKDLFSNIETAKLFYTNDVRVLIDIVVRQLTDLPPNSERRTDYLELGRLVMFSCDPCAFDHRLDELKSRFLHIMLDEVPAVPQDKALVREIMQALPQYFGECPPSA